MQIKFHSAEDTEELSKAVAEYSSIWHKDNEKIRHIARSVTGLDFPEENLTATVHNGRSSSHPLQLRANQPKELKQSTLVHELLHRLCVSNNIQLVDDSESFILAGHKVINLVLYDILVDLYGLELAETTRKTESTYNDEYKQAWGWALSLTRKERSKLFETLKPKNT